MNTTHSHHIFAILVAFDESVRAGPEIGREKFSPSVVGEGAWGVDWGFLFQIYHPELPTTALSDGVSRPSEPPGEKSDFMVDEPKNRMG